MKEKFLVGCLIGLFIFGLLSVFFTSEGYAVTYDLRNDWSDSSNPNGVWSYRQGENVLPLQSDWFGNGSNQKAWALASYPNKNHVPVWLKFQDNYYDFLAGDIAVHPTSHTSSTSQDPANVTWTSPIDGTITISGDIWYGGLVSTRFTKWELYFNDNLLDSGTVGWNDNYDRNNPMQIDGGGLINVNSGDVVKLLLREINGYYSWFTGVNLIIDLEPSQQPVPEPTTLFLFGIGLLGLTFAKLRKILLRRH